MNGLLYDTSTHSASTKEWIQASKNMIISAYSEKLPEQALTKPETEPTRSK